MAAPQAYPGMAVWHKILLLLWFSYLVASPFYIFESGLPQPADLFLATLVLLVLSGLIISVPNHQRLYFFGATFLTIVTVVNLIWWSIYYDYRFFMAVLFYLYNFLALVSIAILTQRFPDQTMRITRYGLLICALAETVAVLYFTPSGMVRAIGTFNNPNQLGYWSLIAFAVWLITKRDEPLGPIDTIVIALLTYVTIGSLSKASIAGFVMLITAAIIFQRFRRSYMVGSVFAAVIFLSVSGLTPALTDMVSDRFNAFLSEGFGAEMLDRMENVTEEEDSNLAGRGYDRIWLFPEYLLYGAGEGANNRFAVKTSKGIEMPFELGNHRFLLWRRRHGLVSGHSLRSVSRCADQPYDLLHAHRRLWPDASWSSLFASLGVFRPDFRPGTGPADEPRRAPPRCGGAPPEVDLFQVSLVGLTPPHLGNKGLCAYKHLPAGPKLAAPRTREGLTSTVKNAPRRSLKRPSAGRHDHGWTSTVDRRVRGPGLSPRTKRSGRPAGTGFDEQHTEIRVR